MKTEPHQELFAGQIDLSFQTAAHMLKAWPASGLAFARIAKGLSKAKRLRQKQTREGVSVPPLLIVSTTEACNLTCAGCYACASHRQPKQELSDQRVSQVLDEASGLGVSIVLLAGGEPLLSHGWLEALAAHEEMAGIVFTNGTLFDEGRVSWFGNHRHIIPTFSIEGDQAQTDARRGKGVHAQVEKAMGDLREKGIPFGVSLTVTGQNIDSLLRDEFVEEYIRKGCILFVFVEYVPVEPGSEPLVLSDLEKKRLSAFALESAQKFPALFLPFPGDEEQYGGCLAAGRGFLHISAGGDVEPCPFAPFSDASLRETSLKEALASRFLSKVRQNHHLLKEGQGGCALWHNREWLEELRGSSVQPQLFLDEN